jgi:hypothetical protein
MLFCVLKKIISNLILILVTTHLAHGIFASFLFAVNSTKARTILIVLNLALFA